MPGIDDMAFYVPKIYLPISELAKNRGIEYDKLNKGLGLTSMSLTDVHEDASTMAANAVKKLIDNNKLSPQSIGRIYIGSESAFDGAKPIASYVLSMLAKYYEEEYGQEAFLNTDVVDMTFACVAGVDALHNTLDWVIADKTRIGIVVSTDDAKYELNSSGEYTQGAGAVAMLVKDSPRLIEINDPIGVATVGVHDFFKPLRRLSKQEFVESIFGSDSGVKDLNLDNIVSSDEQYIDVHKIFPVFDGQYSNECYTQRIEQAYAHYCTQNENHQLQDWDRVVFHLPYAYQGKRMFTEIFYEANKNNPELIDQLLKIDPDFESNMNMKAVAKTELYRNYVNTHIEKGQRASSLIGNLYTGSIFMALMSMLESELDDNIEMENSKVGFFSYGSGSKSKVFQGTVQPEWKTVVSRFSLFDTLNDREAIDFSLYENLHNEKLEDSINPPQNEFYLISVDTEGQLYGKRSYEFAEKVMAQYII